MRRFGVPALATVSFLAFALVHAIDRPVYFAVLRSIHVHPFPRPFLDARFVTAQVECWSRGVDVYVRNPCDPLGRTLDYSPLWLRLPFLARSDGATPVFGLAIDLAFLAALFGLPWRLAGAFDAVVAVGAVMSWATIFAIERGNTDLLMFAAAVLFAHLSTRSAPARIAGYALILCVGLLKFSPLSLLALLVREPARRSRFNTECAAKERWPTTSAAPLDRDDRRLTDGQEEVIIVTCDSPQRSQKSMIGGART